MGEQEEQDARDPSGFVLAPVGGRTGSTSVTYDGDSFLVIWRTTGGAIGAALVSPDGTRRLLRHRLRHGRAVLSNGAGRRAVLYDRFDTGPAFRTRRVRARTIEGDPESLARNAGAGDR